MKFLLDENTPGSLTHRLRSQGHDVVSVRELERFGIADEEMFIWAKREERILISLDYRDFSNLIRFPPQGTCGIIVAHMPKTPLAALVERIEEVIALNPPTFWKNRLTIVETTRLRQRQSII